jgi:hypothetical protein
MLTDLKIDREYIIQEGMYTKDLNSELDVNEFEVWKIKKLEPKEKLK